MNEGHSSIKYYFLLLFVAAAWGFAFVAQRSAMKHVGPFFFTGTRFLIGGILLWLICAIAGNRIVLKRDLKHGLILGLLLFTGISLQQLGLVTTSAGQAGFITGLYILFVPIFLTLFWRESVNRRLWAAAFIALVGLYLVSVSDTSDLLSGNVLVFVCALVFAVHVIAIGKLVANADPFRLAVQQFLICGFLGLLISIFTEETQVTGIVSSIPALAYGSVISIVFGYTMQVYAQKFVPASPAAIILALESVFAAVGGAFILDETLSPLQYVGCGLMLLAIGIALFAGKRDRTPTALSAPELTVAQ